MMRDPATGERQCEECGLWFEELQMGICEDCWIESELKVEEVRLNDSH